MMDDYSAFIRAICENPQDDLVRLVFADWLQDNGEEDRGEFIRESIRKNRNPSQGDYGGLQSVLERHWKSWVPECGNGRIGFELRRGFVSEVRLPLADFLERAGELFAAHPIERVVLTSGMFTATRSSDNEDLNRIARRAESLSYRSQHGMTWDFWDHIIRETGFYGGLIEWPETAKAVEIMSPICVSYGRAVANLPPLPLATPPMKETDAQT